MTKYGSVSMVLYQQKGDSLELIDILNANKSC